jgi:hypothetical protein
VKARRACAKLAALTVARALSVFEKRAQRRSRRQPGTVLAIAEPRPIANDTPPFETSASPICAGASLDAQRLRAALVQRSATQKGCASAFA